MDINAIQKDFPALAHGPFFDNGTVSLTPAPVSAALERILHDTLDSGPPHVLLPENEYPLRLATMTKIADFLGTSRNRVALTRGVSEAFETVLRGLEWHAGDEIVITEDEHAALLLPVLHLRDSVGVKVSKLRFAAASDDPYRALASLITTQTRLVALSHVTTRFGYRFPVRELCDAARTYGVPSFVDVAHSAGVVPFTLDDLGCDFAGALSYKWMYGPYAAGVLYIRAASLGLLALRYAGSRSEDWLDVDTDTYKLYDDTRRFEYGPFAWSIVHGWAAALDYLGRLDRRQVIARTEALVAKLREGLQGIQGVNVLTPPAESAGALVTFTVNDLASSAVQTRLLDEHRIRIKAVPESSFVRASLAVFVSDEALQNLVEAVARIAASG